MKRKFCIFCGKNPVDKNKEHIIPKWLIELTKKPNRKTVVGTNHKGEKINIPWSRYVFPACEVCNSEFGKIEGKVKNITIKLLNEKSISHNELNLFLDWLDKVRTGIWLGQLIFKKYDVDPYFYINQRVGEKDRICLMYKIHDDEKGIGLIGIDCPSFQFAPSSFGLVINNYCFFNYSKEIIVGENLGFPYPNSYLLLVNGQIKIDDMNSGNAKLGQLILEGKILKPSIRLYQSILTGKHNVPRPKIGKRKKFYNDNCNRFTSNVIQSRIYIQNDYNGDSFFWKKGKKYEFKGHQKINRTIIFYFLAKMVIEHQNQSIRQHYANIEEGSTEIIEGFEKLVEINEKELKKIDDFLKKVAPEYYK